MVTAGEFGVVRRANQLMQARKTSGIDSANRNVLGWEFCIENVAGELAVAKMLGVYWQGGIQSKTPIYVRVRKRVDSEMLIKHTEDPDAVYVFVTGEAPRFTIWGAITGENAMNDSFDGVTESSDPKGYVVSKSALLSVPAVLEGCGE